MKTSTTTTVLLTLLSPLLVAGQTSSDPATIAKGLPSCSSKCISSAFSTTKCSSGDWACFCKLPDNAVGNGQDVVSDMSTSDCAAELKVEGGSCSREDIAKTLSTIGQICVSKGIQGGIVSSLAGEASSALAAATSGASDNASAGSTTAAGGSSGSAASTTAASGSAAGAATSGVSASGSMATEATKAATGSAGVKTSTMSGVAAGIDGSNAGFVLALAAFVLGAMA